MSSLRRSNEYSSLYSRPYRRQSRCSDSNSIYGSTTTSSQRRARHQQDDSFQSLATSTSSGSQVFPKNLFLPGDPNYYPQSSPPLGISPSPSMTTITHASQGLPSQLHHFHPSFTSSSTLHLMDANDQSHGNGHSISASNSGRLVSMPSWGASGTGDLSRVGLTVGAVSVTSIVSLGVSEMRGNVARSLVVDPLEVKRSYTVFRRKLLSVKRQERILLLDKQWVHVLPSSTKTLNSMFDTRKSVSYHVRLLVSAKVRSRGGQRTPRLVNACSSSKKSAVVILAFRKGNKGKIKKYNMRTESPAIAVEIVQILMKLKAQFDGGLRIQVERNQEL